MTSLSDSVKDVVNSLSDNIHEYEDNDRMDGVDGDEDRDDERQELGSDLSDDSIDPQIEYDLIISQNHNQSIDEIFAASDQRNGSQDMPSDEPSVTAKDRPKTTTTEVSDPVDDHNCVDNNTDNTSGHKTSAAEETIACETNKPKKAKKKAKALGFKPPKKSSNKSPKKEKKSKKSSNKTTKKAKKSTEKVVKSDKKETKDTKKKSKKVKAIDRKYSVKKKYSGISKELLEQMFGTSDGQAMDTDFEAMYSQQCQQWFQRETRLSGTAATNG